VIETAAGVSAELRLAELHAALAELVDVHAPDAMALEDLYFGANARSAFAVGQARGVAMLAAGQSGIDCFGYTPQQVKAAVCGSGRAPKTQVSWMVKTLLSLPAEPDQDHAGRRARGRDLPLQPRAACRGARGSRAMTPWVRGEVASRQGDSVVVMCAGVGYRLAVSVQTLSAVPPVGREATLHTH